MGVLDLVKLKRYLYLSINQGEAKELPGVLVLRPHLLEEIFLSLMVHFLPASRYFELGTMVYVSKKHFSPVIELEVENMARDFSVRSF